MDLVKPRYWPFYMYRKCSKNFKKLFFYGKNTWGIFGNKWNFRLFEFVKLWLCWLFLWTLGGRKDVFRHVLVKESNFFTQRVRYRPLPKLGQNPDFGMFQERFLPKRSICFLQIWFNESVILDQQNVPWLILMLNDSQTVKLLLQGVVTKVAVPDRRSAIIPIMCAVRNKIFEQQTHRFAQQNTTLLNHFCVYP